MVVRLALVMLAITSVVGAQPIEHPPCSVRIATAPADVRDVIEAWVAAEPRCMRELEVSVATIDGGLHLTARDSAGHVRERIVPDAQSAAVLVVSWMADDSIAPVPPEIGAAASVPSLPRIALEDSGTDDEQPLVLQRHDHHAARPWLTFGVIGSKEGGGLRAQADVLARGRFVLGLSGSWQASPTGNEIDRHTGGDHMGPPAGVATANAFVAASHWRGRLGVRTQLGFGVDVRSTRTAMDTMDHSVSPAINAAVLGQVRIGNHWAAIGGPVVDVPLADGDKAAVAAFFGVQYGR